MANIDVPAHSPATSTTYHDAGFWKRALAFLIDVCLVGTVVPILFLLLATAFPSLDKMVTLSTPFDIGTVERTIESKAKESKDASGNKVIDSERVIERSVLGRWVYRYRTEDRITEYEGDTLITSTRLSYVWQIDPQTGEPIETTDIDTIVLGVLMLYWILADASRAQASLGKRLLGLRVVDRYGVRLALATAAGRNLLKLVSALILLIGFMMAGWTRRRQALHDMIVGAYVVGR